MVEVSTPAAQPRPSALNRYGRFADVNRQRLDELASLAAIGCDAPIALIAFLDESRLWCKASHGWSREWLPREITFCRHAVEPPLFMAVPDALKDDRFRDNPLVLGDPHIRFYAGVPLVTASGECLGTLCVLDRRPRQLTEQQLHSLQLVARQVMVTLELLRQSEERLESEARFRNILDGLGPTIFASLLSPDGIVLETNQSVFDVTGLTRDEVVGQRFDRLMPWTYSGAVVEQLRVALRDAALGKVTRYDVCLRTARGDMIDVDFSLAPVRDGSGRVVFLVPSGVLITERKVAERSARRINRVYALLSEVRRRILREPTVEAILRGACEIAVDRGGMAMAWVGLAEQPGERIRIAAHAGATPDTLEIIERLLGDTPSMNCSVTAKALGSGDPGVCNDIANDPVATNWCAEALARGYRSMAALPIKVGEAVRGTLNLYARETGFFNRSELDLLTELVRDIGLSLELLQRERERAMAEDALRRAERRFREFADNVEQVFWIREATRPRIVYASPAYEKVWRRERSALYEAESGWHATILEEDRPHANAADRARNSGTEATETYRIARPDGEIRWIRERAFASRDESGKVIHIVGIAEDITEARTLEEHVRQSQKLEAIGQLAGGVAHDFNNILTIIEGFAAMLALETNLSSDGKEAVQAIANASSRAAKLTRQLLAFGRKQVVQPEPVDLNEVLRALSALLQRVLGEGVRLVLHLDPHVPPARVDASMLDQVIMNLVINARDAMPRGGELRIETFSATVDADTRGDTPGPGVYAGFRVRDTGVGIAPEHLPRIFEPFFTTKGPGKGTGLGLATVYGIVSQHRGGVFVRSEPGEGAEFEVWLPVANASPRATPREQQSPVMPEQQAVATGRILLVEDDPQVRALTRTVLERAGHRVCEASDGPDALRVWSRQAGEIDLLLTDMVMPGGMTGRDLATQLRKQRPELAVLFMSGYSPEVAGRELIEAERERLLQKPASPQTILEAVRQALRKT